MIDQVAWENALELEVSQIIFLQSIFTKREFIDHRKEDYAKQIFIHDYILINVSFISRQFSQISPFDRRS